MPTRILRDWTDSFVIDQLDAKAERFFVRLIMKADDYGRFHADTRLLRSMLFPLRQDARDTDISRWLAECEKAGLLRCYADERGRPLLQIENFGQRQRTDSKFPAPEACQTIDRKVRTNDGLGGGGGEGVDGTPLPPSGGCPPQADEGLLAEFWKECPKISRQRSSRAFVEKEWRRIPKRDRPASEAILGALSAFKRTWEWRRDDGQAIPGAHRLIQRRFWEDPPEDERPKLHAPKPRPAPRKDEISDPNEALEILKGNDQVEASPKTKP